MTNGLYFWLHGLAVDGVWLRRDTVFVEDGSTQAQADTVYEDLVSRTGPVVDAEPALPSSASPLSVTGVASGCPVASWVIRPRRPRSSRTAPAAESVAGGRAEPSAGVSAAAPPLSSK